jgi:hypothetical protein
VLAFGSYTIRAYSDPQHWLHFARDFANQFTTSYWPYGYPLYLSGVLSAVGPYWVFVLANLPLMVAMFALAAWLGTLLVRSDTAGGGTSPDGEKAPPRSWAFLAVWILAFGADADHFIIYLNPYRDPLSYVLLLLSAGVFIRSLAACRTWGVAASGLLLGLASNVREPSILMVGPFVLYGILAWLARRPELKFWRTVGAFALGLVLGLVPLLVQTYLSTDQLLMPQTSTLIPRESSKESALVPGMYFDGSTLHRSGLVAYRYYTARERLLVWLALAGLVAAVRRRNRAVLGIALPSVLAFALFYAFYRVFVYRYYYVVVLWLVLLAGYGLHAPLRWLCARAPRWGRGIGWLVLAVLAIMSSSRLLGARTHGHSYQIPQARAMVAAWQAMNLGAAEIYSTGNPDRRLCQWIDWFISTPSCPLSNAVPGKVTAETLRAGLLPRMAAGEKFYSAGWQKGLDRKPDAPLLRRTFDCNPAAIIDFAQFKGQAYADAPVWLCLLEPWSNRTARLEWPVPEPGPRGGAYWFMVDAGAWENGPSGQPHAPATLSLGNGSASFAIPHGGAWVGGAVAEAGEAGRTVAATVESGDLLPQDMAVGTGRLDEPITLDFRATSAFDHSWRWSGASIPVLPPATQFGVGIASAAEVEIPVPFPALAGTVLEWELMSEEMARPVSVAVSVREGGTLLGTAVVPGDRSKVRLATPLPPEPDRETRILRVEVGSPEGDQPAPAGVEVLQVRIHRWQNDYPVSTRLGSPQDGIHVLSGFGHAEGRGGKTFRRTAGHAELALYPPATDRSPLLRISYSLDGIPSGGADGGIRVSWDGEELPGRAFLSDDSGTCLWYGAVPARGLDGLCAHVAGIDSTAGPGVRVSHVGLYQWPTNYPVTIPMEDTQDAISVLRSGFSHAERSGSGFSRWTTGHAEVIVCPPAADRPPVLRIDYSTAAIPAQAGHDGGIRVTWDGVELPGQAGQVDGNGHSVWQGTVPDGGCGGQSPHVIGIDSATWKPADFGVGDSRTLGVIVFGIELAPPG